MNYLPETVTFLQIIDFKLMISNYRVVNYIIFRYGIASLILHIIKYQTKIHIHIVKSSNIFGFDHFQ